MNAENLLIQIKQRFKDITLGDAYTLAEEHYAYTHHYHLEERKFFNSDLSDEDWKQQAIQWIKNNNWLQADQDEAIQSIEQHRKMVNRYQNPLTIPYEYIEHYFINFFGLDSQIYLFYTPSIMIHALKDLSILETKSFQSWLFCLSWIDINTLLKDFQKIQIDTLLNFFAHLQELDYLYVGFEEIQKCIHVIKTLNHYYIDDLTLEIHQAFKDVTLGNAYTLAEQNYYDKHHWHFDEQPISNVKRATGNQQAIQWIQTNNWLQADQDEAIQAIQQQRKMLNRLPNPLAIPDEYIDCYYAGFTSLSSQAYLFYTPSLILHALKHSAFNTPSFKTWLYCLSYLDIKDLLKDFQKVQADILLDFLEYILNSTDTDIDHQEIETCIDRIKTLDYYHVDYLTAEIHQAFKDVTLGDAYTLAETDYYEGRWYFNSTARHRFYYPDLTLEEAKQKEIKELQTYSWLKEDEDEAIQAIREQRKMANRFLSPFDVTLAYLNRYPFGFSFLQPQAYLFYTPAAMLDGLHDASEKQGFTCLTGFEQWFSLLERFNTKEILQCFSQRQIEVLTDFLRYIRWMNIVKYLKITYKCISSINYA